MGAAVPATPWRLPLLLAPLLLVVVGVRGSVGQDTVFLKTMSPSTLALLQFGGDAGTLVPNLGIELQESSTLVLYFERFDAPSGADFDTAIFGLSTADGPGSFNVTLEHCPVSATELEQGLNATFFPRDVPAVAFAAAVDGEVEVDVLALVQALDERPVFPGVQRPHGFPLCLFLEADTDISVGNISLSVAGTPANSRHVLAGLAVFEAFDMNIHTADFIPPDENSAIAFLGVPLGTADVVELATLTLVLDDTSGPGQFANVEIGAGSLLSPAFKFGALTTGNFHPETTHGIPLGLFPGDRLHLNITEQLNAALALDWRRYGAALVIRVRMPLAYRSSGQGIYLSPSLDLVLERPATPRWQAGSVFAQVEAAEELQAGTVTVVDTLPIIDETVPFGAVTFSGVAVLNDTVLLGAALTQRCAAPQLVPTPIGGLDLGVPATSFGLGSPFNLSSRTLLVGAVEVDVACGSLSFHVQELTNETLAMMPWGQAPQPLVVVYEHTGIGGSSFGFTDGNASSMHYIGIEHSPGPSCRDFLVARAEWAMQSTDLGGLLPREGLVAIPSGPVEVPPVVAGFPNIYITQRQRVLSATLTANMVVHVSPTMTVRICGLRADQPLFSPLLDTFCTVQVVDIVLPEDVRGHVHIDITAAVQEIQADDAWQFGQDLALLAQPVDGPYLAGTALVFAQPPEVTIVYGPLDPADCLNRTGEPEPTASTTVPYDSTSGTTGMPGSPCGVPCPPELASGISWPQACALVTVPRPCAAGLVGAASRTCLGDGIWAAPNTSACEHLALTNESTFWEAANLANETLQEAVREFGAIVDSAPVQGLGARDLDSVATVVSAAIALALNSSTETLENVTTTLLAAIDRLMDDNIALSLSNPVKAETVRRELEAVGLAMAARGVSLDFVGASLVVATRPFPPASGAFPGLAAASGTSSFDLPGAAPPVRPAAAYYSFASDGWLQGSREPVSQVVAVVLDVDTAALSLPFRFEVSTAPLLAAGAHCAFWDVEATQWSSAGCTTVAQSDFLLACACDHLTNFAAIASPHAPPAEHRLALQIITGVGGTVAVISLVVLLVMLVSIRHNPCFQFPQQIVCCMCVSLATFNTTVMFGLDRGGQSHAQCMFTSLLLHYSMLVTFVLCGVHGYGMHRALTQQTFKQPPHFFASSLALALGIPLLIVVVSAAVSPGEYTNDEYCWLDLRSSLATAVVLPLALICSANLYIFLRTLWTLKTHRPEYLTVAAALGIFCSLGLVWVFAILAFVHPDALVWQYLFAVGTSAQSVFLLYSQIYRAHEIRSAVLRSSWLTKGTTKSTPVFTPSKSHRSANSRSVRHAARRNRDVAMRKMSMDVFLDDAIRDTDDTDSEYQNCRPRRAIGSFSFNSTGDSSQDSRPRRRTRDVILRKVSMEAFLEDDNVDELDSYCAVESTTTERAYGRSPPRELTMDSAASPGSSPTSSAALLRLSPPPAHDGPFPQGDVYFEI